MTIEHIARTLWISAYADGIESGAIIDEWVDSGFSGEWNDAAPDTPPEALRKAMALAATIGAYALERMEVDWIDATGLDSERFGHCLALQALGHGVGLIDDVPLSSGYDRPRLPLIEFSIHDLGDLPDGVEWGELPD